MRTFDLQDEIYSWLSTDSQLLSLLGDPTGDKELNEKIRREEQDATLLTTDQLPFMAFYFPPSAHKTKNMFINKGILYIDYYVTFREDAKEISGRVWTLIKQNTEINIPIEGQLPSGVTGILKFRQIFAPLVSG